MNLSSRLIIGFCIFGVICLVIGGSSYLSISNIENKLSEQVNVTNVSGQLVEARDSVFDYILNDDNSELLNSKLTLNNTATFLNDWHTKEEDIQAEKNKQVLLDTIEVFNFNQTLLENIALEEKEVWFNVKGISSRMSDYLHSLDHSFPEIANRIRAEYRWTSHRRDEIKKAFDSLERLKIDHQGLVRTQLLDIQQYLPDQQSPVVKSQNHIIKKPIEKFRLALLEHFEKHLIFSDRLINKPEFSEKVRELKAALTNDFLGNTSALKFESIMETIGNIQTANETKYASVAHQKFMLDRLNKWRLAARGSFLKLRRTIVNSDRINPDMVATAKKFLPNFKLMTTAAKHFEKAYPSASESISILDAKGPFFHASSNLVSFLETLETRKQSKEIAFLSIANAMDVAFNEIRANSSIMASEANNLRESSARTILVNVVFALLLGLYAIVFTARRLTQDIKVITRTMLNLSRGRLKEAVPFADRKDEIGEMAGALEIFKNNALELKSMDASLRRIVGAIESASDAILIFDSFGEIIHINQSFAKKFHHTDITLLNGEAFLSLHKSQKSSEIYQDCFQTGASWAGEITMLSHSDRELTMTMRLDPIEDDELNIMGYVALYTDITDRKKAEDHIRKLAHFDALTGLANRTQFQDKIASQLKVSKETQSVFSVLMLDLDRFKQVNDTMGHDAGDILLRQVSARILDTIGTEYFVARLGGDEFALILDGADVGEAEQVSMMIVDALKIKFDIMGQEVMIGGSIGISYYPKDGTRTTGLMKKADMALYAAKANGRGTVSSYDDSMLAETEKRRDLEQRLRKGSEDQEFYLHFQPKICLRTGKVRGAEALLRWKHEGKFISPQEFIPVAEETGLMNSIGKFALHNACRAAASWGHIDVAVNVSPVQFHSGEIIEDVKSAIEFAGLSPKQLILEITEGLLLKDDSIIHEQLQYLRKMGVRISLDDFGTGYSSLGYLSKFPLDELKIDKSFVNNLGTDEGCGIVQSVIDLSQTLGLKTVAEGVETLEQYAFLKDSGCSLVQGYLFSPAISSQDMLDLGEKKFSFTIENVLKLQRDKTQKNNAA